MKFYEQMNPIDRKIMVLEAAAGNASLEGHYKPAQVLIEEADVLRAEQAKHIRTDLKQTSAHQEGL